jgi:hypothetical protein
MRRTQLQVHTRAPISDYPQPSMSRAVLELIRRMFTNSKPGPHFASKQLRRFEIFHGEIAAQYVAAGSLLLARLRVSKQP